MQESLLSIPSWKVGLLLLGTLLGAPWVWVFAQHTVSNPLIFWLPCGNLAATLIALYIDSDSKALIAEVEKIDAFKYDFKKI